jgi:hypothetical protein
MMTAEHAPTEQVETVRVTIQNIIRSRSFQAGVAEVRAGRPPRFDRDDRRFVRDDWGYERGRQFGIVAPRSLPLMIGRRVNPRAVSIFMRHIL